MRATFRGGMTTRPIYFYRENFILVLLPRPKAMATRNPDLPDGREEERQLA
jgi:hypothetical protein